MLLGCRQTITNHTPVDKQEKGAPAFMMGTMMTRLTPLTTLTRRPIHRRQSSQPRQQRHQRARPKAWKNPLPNVPTSGKTSCPRSKAWDVDTLTLFLKRFYRDSPEIDVHVGDGFRIINHIIPTVYVIHARFKFVPCSFQQVFHFGVQPFP